MPDLINILGVVYVMLYVFSIAGMTLFSGMALLPFPQDGTGYDHHSNFDNIYRAMQTVFQVRATAAARARVRVWVRVSLALTPTCLDRLPGEG
jgi:hypothetical protein